MKTWNMNRYDLVQRHVARWNKVTTEANIWIYKNNQADKEHKETWFLVEREPASLSNR